MYNRENLKHIPNRPGIYIMHNAMGDIIYVGKAKNLHNRVRQYFQSAKNLTPKTVTLVSHVESIETMVVDTEMEALILECNLIKEHRPRYNIMLKDDKSYPYIKLTLSDAYPKVVMTRNHKRDGSKYFGPFTNSTAVKQTIEALHKIYPLRRCNRKVAYGVQRGRPCLNFHIGQCCAPCTGKVSSAAYQADVDAILAILNGKDKELIARLTEEMDDASRTMDYETAAKRRDQISGIKLVVEKQKIISDNEQDQDIIAFYKKDNLACVQVFNVRNGKLLGRHHSFMEGVLDSEPETIMTAFVKQYYDSCPFIPGEIIVMTPLETEEAHTIVLWLEQIRGTKIQVTLPQKGKKARLLQMVTKNAELTLEQYLLEQRQKEEKKKSRLDSLKDLLAIQRVPHRIEAFDISNISGTNNVGGMIVFEDGRPQKKAYRRFKIQTVEGQNDYGSMQEMLFRRVERGIKEQKQKVMPGQSSFLPFPEVWMIDGGKTHVEAAVSILSMYPELDIAVCGLVKDEHHRLRGLIYQDEEYPLDVGTPICTFLNEISEEVHRFALGYHQILRKKSMLTSKLEEIPGIGTKRRAALMRYYGNVDKIKKADINEMSTIAGMNLKAAQAVANYFNKGDKTV